MIVVIIGSVLVYDRVNNAKYNHYVDIDDIVKEAYISPRAYNSDMAKHISKDVYNSLNAYIYYNNNTFKQPIKASLTLNEINQHKINGKIFVYMQYDFQVYDADGKLASASWETPVIFTVGVDNNNLYIEKKQEFETSSDVPRIYR